jgi:hypothetical protein
MISFLFVTKIEHPKGPKGLFDQKIDPMQLFLGTVRQSTEAHSGNSSYFSKMKHHYLY